MRRVVFLYLLTITIVFRLSSQEQAYNWAFGYNAGLTWRTTAELEVKGLNGIPDATLNNLPTSWSSAIHTNEGCFSLSDAIGNLLFYSDGMTIWDRNNHPMPNGTGLSGDASSAQSGIILPNPGHPSQYITVTISNGCNGGLAYSVIDMSLNNGLGDVVTDKKDIVLTGASGSCIGESVSSVMHANGDDYWIVAPARGTPTYLNVWLVTGSGIDAANPVITNISPVNKPVGSTQSCGYFKFTPDGKHFAWAVEDNYIIYGDFDSNTGQFSNVRRYNSPTNSYGIEFSPSMKYLYIGARQRLRVIDFEAMIESYNPDTLSYHDIVLTDYNRTTPQLAPDGRIYIAHSDQANLGFVDNPDEYNDLKVYQLPDDILGSGRSRIGLPSFAASWFLLTPDIDEGKGGIGVNTETPDLSSILDINSVSATEPRGMLISRMTTVEKNAINEPAHSLLVYDLDLKCISQNLGTRQNPVWNCLSIPNRAFFYMPSINIDTSTLGTFNLDLYEQYKKEYSTPKYVSDGAPSSIPYFASPNQLYYYIGYYDSNCITVHGIDENGIMSYSVINYANYDSYMNIIFVVK